VSQNEPVRRSDLDEYRKRLGPRDLMVERRNGKANGLLPQRYSAALRAFHQRRDVDQYLVLSEDMGFVLAGLLRAVGWKGQLQIIVHAGQGARRRRLFRLTDSDLVKNYIVFCERQRQILINEIGLDAGKVNTLLNPVDTVFFDSSRVSSPSGAGGYVFACGLENRDYDTLFEAAAKTDLPHIIQATGYFVEETNSAAQLSNVDVRKQRVSFERLRELYHESAFVVVPLNSVDYAAGVNGILEAMAMGKAVIAMQSPGLEDYIRVEGVCVVPPKDPRALADAMKDLRASPERCAELGAINRKWVVEQCEVSDYADKVSALMEQTPTAQ